MLFPLYLHACVHVSLACVCIGGTTEAEKVVVDMLENQVRLAWDAVHSDTIWTDITGYGL